MSNIIPIDKSKPMVKDLKNPVPLEQTLPLVFAKMGLKPENWPSKDPKFNEWQLLLDHIKTNYRTIRVEEIKIAFEYALKNKFEVDTQHYQNFSCEYFSRIMNAYLKYKAPFSRQLPPEKKNQDHIDYNWIEIEGHILKPFKAFKINSGYPYAKIQETMNYERLNRFISFPKHLNEKYIVLSRGLPEDQKQELREEYKAEVFRVWFKEKALNCTYEEFKLELKQKYRL